jgi:hypothetical protein
MDRFQAAIEIIDEERLRLAKLCDNHELVGRLNYALQTMADLWFSIQILRSASKVNKNAPTDEFFQQMVDLYGVICS